MPIRIRPVFAGDSSCCEGVEVDAVRHQHGVILGLLRVLPPIGG